MVSLFCTIQNINLKCIKDLSVVPENKTPKRKHGEKLHEIGNEFLYKTLKAQAAKAKINRHDYMN